MTYEDCDKPGEVDSVSGCCLMVRREVVEKVGMLDENFIMYGDDLDWCYRIKQAGWKVCYVPEIRIVHLGGQSSRRLPRRCIVLFYRAMAVFYRKHYAQRHIFIVNWIVCAGIWLKACIALGVNFFRKEKVVGSKKPRLEQTFVL